MSGIATAFRYLYSTGEPIRRADWDPCVYVSICKERPDIALLITEESGVPVHSVYIPTKFDFLLDDWVPCQITSDGVRELSSAFFVETLYENENSL